jgi:hypothetical protein
LPGGSTAVINCWTWVKRVFILPILRSQRCRLFVIAFDLEYLPVSLMDEDTAPVITVPGAGSFDPVWVACHLFLSDLSAQNDHTNKTVDITVELQKRTDGL